MDSGESPDLRCPSLIYASQTTRKGVDQENRRPRLCIDLMKADSSFSPSFLFEMCGFLTLLF